MNKLRKTILRVARYVIPHMPKGKSEAIRVALFLGGNMFEDIITMPDGRKFFIKRISAVNRHLFFLNDYEKHESHVVQKIVEAGNYTIDVGANFGWYSTLMSKLVGSSGKVFAFELVPSHLAGPQSQPTSKYLCARARPHPRPFRWSR